MTNIFDTHAHYTDSAFDSDRDYLLSKYLPKSGIKHVLLAGCNIKESLGNVELSKKYDYIYAAAGFHPDAVAKGPLEKSDFDALINIIENNDIKAVGEIGLDYHYEPYNKAWQREIFEKQLEIAKDFNLPVIIHSRDATADYLEILEKYRPRGVVHCFSGSADTCKIVVEKLGMYVGFTGAITFKNAKKAPEAVACCPVDRLLFETDCPYMAPDAFKEKGKRRPRSDSSMIAETAKVAAGFKNMDTQKLIDLACENGERLFNIK